MDQQRADEVLRRFGPVMEKVARTVTEMFPSVTEAEDAQQDAGILILSYAGLVPGGRLSGKLQDWEEITGNDPEQVDRLISNQLRLDLSQQYGREAEKSVPTVSLAEVTEDSAVCDFTERMTGDISSSRFPFLHAHYSRGMTVQEISDASGLSRRTVDRRIAGEKRRFAGDYCKRAGLVVEGDETTEELTEAYGYLKAAGR